MTREDRAYWVGVVAGGLCVIVVFLYALVMLSILGWI